MLKLENIPNYEQYHYLIDVSNICYIEKTADGKPMLQNYVKLIEYLINVLNIPKDNIHPICDANLPYIIDNREELELLIDAKEILRCPAGRKADDFILIAAINYDFCFILGNDRYKSYKLPYKDWLRDRKISMMIVDDKVCLSPDIDNDRINIVFPDFKKVKSKNFERIDVNIGDNEIAIKNN